jgi:hypothetical protein
MESIHHRPIKRFSLDGVIQDDSKIGRLKEEYLRILHLEMKLSGYVPRLDIDPDFTIEYNVTGDSYNFEISIYGTYVGKKKSEWVVGIDGTDVISSQEIRSKESSQPRVLKYPKS